MPIYQKLEVAVNQGYRYLGDIENGWLSTCGGENGDFKCVPLL
jgi:hypothetical protein